ncbi:MAG: FtsQ-type POTRA domain-containing protein [candidate division Zixibacteria bacterium]|nr:FtsQ-type POTRA domain-containing protein [candidate division Zixibacteria bacterium]
MTPNRRRWFGHLFLLVGGVLATGSGAAGAVIAGQSVYAWMLYSPRFSIREIVVTGAETVGVDEIAAISGIARGDNIFQADPIDAGERLRRDRRFDDVFVRRVMPGRIDIFLKEKKPVALVQLDRMYGVDYNGELLPTPASDRITSLPIITGVVPEQGGIVESFAEGRTSFAEMADSIHYNVKVDRAIYIIEMIRAFSPGFVDRISEVHVDQIHDPVVYTTETGTTVRLGIGHYPDKIKQLEQILTRLKEDKIETRWIDLRFDNQVIVRPILTADAADTLKS